MMSVPERGKGVVPFLKLICSSVLLLLLQCYPAIAADQPAGRMEQAGEFFIASSLKTAAKGFVAAGGLAKAQAKIQSLDETAFRREYVYAYEYIRDYPQLVEKEGLKPALSKKEALGLLESWDNAKAYKVIDSLPNHTVAAHFQYYLGSTGRDMENVDWVQAARDLFDRLNK